MEDGTLSCGNASVAATGAAEAGTREAKLTVFKSVFVSILIYGHEPWVMTDRTRIRAAEMAFLRRISGLTMLDRVRSSEIRDSLSRAATSADRKITAPILRTRDADVFGQNCKQGIEDSRKWIQV
ncbi:Uncharacterised protein r2_g1491 [Pycnogonum litorale]